MNIENITQGVEKNFLFKDLKSYGYSINFLISSDSTNCKLSYIHGIGGLIQVNDNNEKIEIITYLLRNCKGCVIINTTQKEIYSFIQKNYKVYYHHEVPIGYSNGFQYHICIKNDILVNANCKDPVKNVENNVTKEAIKTKLISILKQKRRKDDYVDELINSL